MSLQIVRVGSRIRTVFILLILGFAPLAAHAQPPAQPPAQPAPTTTQPPPTTTQPPATTTEPATTTADEGGVVFVGAGDIANCEVAGGGGARATAALLDSIEGTVFTTGDHAYQTGSAKDFKNCYDPTWGRHKARTRPTVGNHDLITDKGKPYFDYFGEN